MKWITKVLYETLSFKPKIYLYTLYKDGLYSLYGTCKVKHNDSPYYKWH